MNTPKEQIINYFRHCGLTGVTQQDYQEKRIKEVQENKYIIIKKQKKNSTIEETVEIEFENQSEILEVIEETQNETGEIVCSQYEVEINTEDEMNQ
jgi:hypothetical protein